MKFAVFALLLASAVCLTAAAGDLGRQASRLVDLLKADDCRKAVHEISELAGDFSALLGYADKKTAEKQRESLLPKLKAALERKPKRTACDKAYVDLHGLVQQLSHQPWRGPRGGPRRS